MDHWLGLFKGQITVKSDVPSLTVGLQLLLWKSLVELLCCRWFLTWTTSSHHLAWGHSKSLLEASHLSKHHVIRLAVMGQVFPDRIHRLWKWLYIWFKVALSLDRWARDLWSSWHSWCWFPIATRLKHFLFQPLFFIFHLSSLLLSHEVLLHSLFPLADIKVIHLVWSDTLVCPRRKQCLLLRLTFRFSF